MIGKRDGGELVLRAVDDSIEWRAPIGSLGAVSRLAVDLSGEWLAAEAIAHAAPVPTTR
jgi:hypothetical protein